MSLKEIFIGGKIQMVLSVKFCCQVKVRLLLPTHWKLIKFQNLYGLYDVSKIFNI